MSCCRAVGSKRYCVREVNLTPNDGLQGESFVWRQHMELLTDLFGPDKHANPAPFCPVQLLKGHLALIKIPSELLMRNS